MKMALEENVFDIGEDVDDGSGWAPQGVPQYVDSGALHPAPVAGGVAGVLGLSQNPELGRRVSLIDGRDYLIF